MYFYKSPTCKSQVQNTSRMSLVTLSRLVKKILDCQNRSSSIEEERDELLKRHIMRRPRKFEERRLFDVQNPREFREKFRLPVDAFIYLLEFYLNRPAEEKILKLAFVKVHVHSNGGYNYNLHLYPDSQYTCKFQSRKYYY